MQAKNKQLVNNVNDGNARNVIIKKEFPEN